MPMVLRLYLAKHDHARVVQPLGHQVTHGLHAAQYATGCKGKVSEDAIKWHDTDILLCCKCTPALPPGL